MSKTQVNPIKTASVLSISPIDSDHDALKKIVYKSDLAGYTNTEWVLHTTPKLKSALPLLRCNQVGIVISERDLGPGSWKDVLAELHTFPNPPLLIVSSWIADEYLWAEALNLGAHDVLAKPFDAEEVSRVLAFGWERWKSRTGSLHNQRYPMDMLASA